MIADYLLTAEVGHPFAAVVADLVRRHEMRSICDFGGGANPVLDPDTIERFALRYLVVDVDPGQLGKTPPEYETRLLNPMGDDVDFGSERFDLVVSRFVAEHVPDPSRFHVSVRGALAAGGRAAHFFPRWASRSRST